MSPSILDLALGAAKRIDGHTVEGFEALCADLLENLIGC